ncbi:MAG: hypothetical protein C0518_02485 [Opitutus sp.]|nr:hypothetical protein [Opitutus sp.]
MGNKTNPGNWSARERLLYIDQLAYWRGWVRRGDLCEKFGISVPQASADFSTYLQQNPRALQYNLNRKRYEASATMRPAFGEGTLEEALQVWQNDPGQRLDRVARISLPERTADARVTRNLVRATFERDALEIYYFSIHSGTEKWRVIRPHAFAHDGYRWHVRAWCEEDEAYKDFVLGRIAKTRPGVATKTPPPDEEWTSFVTLRFRAHPNLSPIQREALARDFGMKGGIGKLKVRKALLFYTQVYLGLGDVAQTSACRLHLVSTSVSA